MMYCRIGFVTQDDVLFPHLTVKETLTYAALLRLPKSLTREEKEKRATDVIYELGLERRVQFFPNIKIATSINVTVSQVLDIGN